MRVLVTSLSLVLVSTLVAPVFAADAPPEADSHTRTAARTLAAEGTQAFEQRDYARALDLFERALSLVRAPTLGLMRARTLVELGRWVEAVDAYATLPRGDDDPNNPAFRQAMEEAEHELAALLPRLPRLRVSVRGLDRGHPEVRIDGRKLEEALVGVDNPVDPGPHRIEVLTPGRAPEVREVTVAERDKKELVIEHVALEPTPRPEPIAPPPRPVPQEPNGLGTPAIASFAAAGAGVLLGGITGAIALGKKSDLDAACSADCPESMRSTLSAYRLQRALSYVGFGVALAGAGAGSYFLMTDSESEDPATVSLGLSPTGVLVAGTF
jgi:tetratricopeptide (TPR) repeat protein